MSGEQNQTEETGLLGTIKDGAKKLVPGFIRETWEDLNKGNELKKDLEQAKITGKSEHHADNYAHILTDAKIAQKGKLHAAAALTIGVGKEVYDFTTKVCKGANIKETWDDCKKDMKNNLTGLKWGIKNPNANAEKWLSSLDLESNTFIKNYDNGIAAAIKQKETQGTLKANLQNQNQTAKHQIESATAAARIAQHGLPDKVLGLTPQTISLTPPLQPSKTPQTSTLLPNIKKSQNSR